MITIGLLVWVGIRLNAPALFYVLLGISAMFKLLSWGIALGKEVSK